ncbi:hypothetical protein THASP1DRAFT_19078, partial [Thamnocephalis sphaerospora]
SQYRTYCGSKARYMNEQFIERFDLDLITLPDTLPDWFVGQRQMLVCMLLRRGCMRSADALGTMRSWTTRRSCIKRKCSNTPRKLPRKQA